MGTRPPQMIGRYAIYGGIASGGMASVYFGRLLGGAGFSRTVAIKRLHPHLAEEQEFLSTMIDEARMAARIHHPNVVPTLDVVATEGELLLVMEYVRGESLSRLLKMETDDGRRVPLPIASAIAIGTLHGLHAAHEATSDRGEPLAIVHRDVSPQNILVGVDGMPRVIDFGVAKAAGRLQTTREGIVKGKIGYMAPEQLAGHAVTRAADLYAMGVVLWEMLTGKRLFQGESDAALVTEVLAGTKDPPSRHAPNNLPAALDALVMRALALDPAHRFATARDMADVLLRVVPPAFPTDVGTWCEQVARGPLAKRATLLAEIESGSEMGATAVPAGGALEPSKPAQAKIEGGTVRLEQRESTSYARPGSSFPPQPDPARSEDNDAPFHASQTASLSSGAMPTGVPRRSSTRAMLAAALGVGVLVIGGLAAVVLGGRTTPATSGPPTPTLDGAASAPVPLPAESASASATSEPAASGVPAPPIPAPPPAPSPNPVLTPQHLVLAPAPPHPHASPVAPKPKCNPPYEIDSAGHHQYKPECL